MLLLFIDNLGQIILAVITLVSTLTAGVAFSREAKAWKKTSQFAKWYKLIRELYKELADLEETHRQEMNAERDFYLQEIAELKKTVENYENVRDNCECGAFREGSETTTGD